MPQIVMDTPDDIPTIATPITPNFRLSSPEVIVPVSPDASRQAVPLRFESLAEVETLAARFVEALAAEDLRSSAFKVRLGNVLALGREEISGALTLLKGQYLQRHLSGIVENPAYDAVTELRALLSPLHPHAHGDLLVANRLMGIIPMGNKLKSYFRLIEAAGEPLHQAVSRLCNARDDVQRDIVDIEAARGMLWAAMQKLASAAQFAQLVDEKVTQRLPTIKTRDPMRADAMQQDVLPHARRNLADVLAHLAVCVNAYRVLDMKKKCGRAVMNGCNRVASTSVSALSVSQTVARATGNPIRVMNMLEGTNTAFAHFVSEMARQLESDSQAAVRFGREPQAGVDKVKDSFDQAIKAMDAMGSFRIKAADVMAKNHEIVKKQVMPVT